MPHENKRTISVLVTTLCNLACSYCVNDIKAVANQETIDLDFVKTGIDDFFGKRTDLFGEGNRNIRIYGVGESTTRIDLVKRIVKYAREINPDVAVELQTNAHFSEENAKWVAENINEVWVSLDGPPEVQDRNRPTKTGERSSEVVIRNLKYLVDRTFVGVRATVRPEDSDKQIEFVEYFYSLGVRHVAIEPVFKNIKRKGGYEDPISQEDLARYVGGYIPVHRRAQELGMEMSSLLTMNFDSPCNYACRSLLPMPQLTPDGYVSGCDLASHGNTQLQDFIFGKFDGKRIIYFQDKIDRIKQRHVANIDECASCEVKKNCGGGCAGLAYSATGDLMGTHEPFCDSIKKLARVLPRNQGELEHHHP